MIDTLPQEAAAPPPTGRGVPPGPAGAPPPDRSPNPEAELAFRFVTETNQNVFLTGRAGTGTSAMAILTDLSELPEADLGTPPWPRRGSRRRG